MDLRALPLIEVDRSGLFQVSSEALDFLRSVKKPIAVISIAGAYRSGKSFLMNRLLLNRFSGFQTAPTIQACTKGLWVWNQPLDVTSSDGVECSLLVVDSEGLGDTNEDANHDTRIYMLAMLLSSMFLFNGKIAIDEHSLSTMALMLEMCKNLQVRGEGSEEELASYFPSLLWVIRDFSLRLEGPDGLPLTMTQYLGMSLEDQKGTSNAVETKNRARRLIKHFFRERDCFGLIRPTEDERALQNLIDDSQLRPEFLAQIHDLYSLVMKRIKPKRMRGKLLSGELLGSLAISYTTAINQGGVPNILSSWSNVCRGENQRLVREAEEQYEAVVAAKVGEQLVSEEELAGVHKAAKADILVALKAQTVGSTEEVTPFIAQALSKIKEKYASFRQSNERRITTKCEALMKMFGDEAIAKLRSSQYRSLPDYRKDLELYVGEMRKRAPVTLRTEIRIREVMERMTMEAGDYLTRVSETEKDNEVRKLKEGLSAAQGQLGDKKEEWERERKQLQSRLQEAETSLNSAKAQTISLSSRVEDLLSDRKHAEETFREQLQQQREDSRERYDELKQRFQQAQQTIADLNKNYAKEAAELKKDLSLARQEVEYRAKECEEGKKKRAELEEDCRTNRSEILRLKHQIDSLESDLKQASSHPQTAEPSPDLLAEKQRLLNQVELLKSQLTERQSVQDVLMSALQSRASEQPRSTERALETATNLASALERNEQRCGMLEKKVEMLKRYHKMVKNCAAMQCKLCSKTVGSAVFGAHLTVCVREGARTTSTPHTPMSISITQASVREDSESRSYTEYLITVTYRGKTWTVNRRYKLFSQLNEQLEKDFSSVEMPEEAEMFRRSITVGGKPKTIDERRKALQSYLNQLAATQGIRESHWLLGFLGVDQYFPEDLCKPDDLSRSQSLTDSYSRSVSLFEPIHSPSRPEDVDFS